MCLICDARAVGMSDAEGYEMFERNMMDDIHLHGLALTGVYDGEPPFVYSAGRAMLNLPELFMVGYPPTQFFAAVINNVHRAQMEEGLHVHPGEQLDGFLANDHPLAVVQIDPVKAEMNATLSLFAKLHTEVRAIQLVWPDDKGRFPWDEAFDHDRFPQPLHLMDQE